MRPRQCGDPLRGSSPRQPIGTRQGQDRLRAWGAKRLRAAVPRSGRRQTYLLFADFGARRVATTASSIRGFQTSGGRSSNLEHTASMA